MSDWMSQVWRSPNFGSDFLNIWHQILLNIVRESVQVCQLPYLDISSTFLPNLVGELSVWIKQVWQLPNLVRDVNFSISRCGSCHTLIWSLPRFYQILWENLKCGSCQTMEENQARCGNWQTLWEMPILAPVKTCERFCPGLAVATPWERFCPGLEPVKYCERISQVRQVTNPWRDFRFCPGLTSVNHCETVIFGTCQTLSNPVR